MSRPAPRQLEVIRCTQVTPHMRRITLGGEGMASFPADQESAYIKLILPRANKSRPWLRTYTVRHQRDNEIDVDFVIHDHPGPASAWALECQPGDTLLVGGPGPKKLANPQADWFFLVGDMTALPAISVNLALLPDDARGHAVIEVTSDEDRQALSHPDGLELHWVTSPQPDPKGAVLDTKVRSLPWLEGQAAAWIACEFNGMRRLRRYFKLEREVPKSHLYVSSYWKIGHAEDAHKLVKKLDNALHAA